MKDKGGASVTCPGGNTIPAGLVNPPSGTNPTPAGSGVPAGNVYTFTVPPGLPKPAIKFGIELKVDIPIGVGDKSGPIIVVSDELDELTATGPVSNG